MKGLILLSVTHAGTVVLDQDRVALAATLDPGAHSATAVTNCVVHDGKQALPQAHRVDPRGRRTAETQDLDPGLSKTRRLGKGGVKIDIAQVKPQLTGFLARDQQKVLYDPVGMPRRVTDTREGF